MHAPPDTETLRWEGELDGCLSLIDQTLLPNEVRRIECRDVASVWEAIKMLRVRGAPAIGIAAAYGVCLGVRESRDASPAEFAQRLGEVVDYLGTSRPTAVNLFWALRRMRARAREHERDGSRDRLAVLLREARSIHEEDREICRAIGRHGSQLLGDGQGVLTHCNAGGLATSAYGTALSILFTAHDAGKSPHVFVDETRPLLQGARLTAWELMQHGVDTTLICDSMAAQVMKEGKVQAVVTGADRIAANGDSANKIGTYGVAVLAQAHNIPFYIAAPKSTFDLSIGGGAEIPIEQRRPEEVTHGFGKPTAPPGVPVYNPAFDVTPAALIRAIVTELGVIQPVTAERISAVLGESK